MIVELVGAVNPQGQDIEDLTYQRTLFPALAMKKEDYQSLRKGKRWATTHVSHGAIEELSPDVFHSENVSP